MSGWVDGQGDGCRISRQLGVKPVVAIKQLVLVTCT